MTNRRMAVKDSNVGAEKLKRLNWTDFSIDGLLKEPYLPCCSTCSTLADNDPAFPQDSVKSVNFVTSVDGDRTTISYQDRNAINVKDRKESDENKSKTFSWLSCSRFKPPKLPRRNKGIGRSKRYGRGPRIPFAAHQIKSLEDAFIKSHYLNADNIRRLAESLNLSEIRVKIWFQNRRARFRRDQEMASVEPRTKTNSFSACADPEGKETISEFLQILSSSSEAELGVKSKAAIERLEGKGRMELFSSSLNKNKNEKNEGSCESCEDANCEKVSLMAPQTVSFPLKEYPYFPPFNSNCKDRGFFPQEFLMISASELNAMAHFNQILVGTAISAFAPLTKWKE